MKKIYLTAKAVIFILSFYVVLTSCSMQDKLGTDINHPSEIRKTNETRVLSTSSVPEAVKSTKPGNSPKPDNINTIDYNQYIKKVWVVRKGNNEIINYPSFFISKIENGKVVGKFSLILDVPGNASDFGPLTGTINKDTAECQFDNGHGNKGNIKLVFKNNNEMEATFMYSDKEDPNIYFTKGGIPYQYIPFNIKNLNGFIPIKNQSFMVNLNSWGNVKFVSGKIKGERYTTVYYYLTDVNSNIVYNFHSNNVTNVDVSAVSFKDVNKDSLKDIIIIVKYFHNPGYGNHFVNVFFQKPNGSFSDNSELDQEINDSGNNKDIKTVTDYLSKKF